MINIGQLEETIRTRRSIRRYRPDKVPREKIMDLFSLAAFAPSSCNLQAWQFVVVDDDETKKSVVRKGKVNRQVLNAPAVIVAAYNRNVTRENDANVQSLAAAIQTFMLLAHSEGLGTLWVCNFKNETGIREVLNMPDIYRVLAVIEVGYPDEAPDPPKRNPVDSFVSFNTFLSDDVIPDSTRLSGWRWKDILNWQKRFARRGYPLEKYTDPEKREISRLIAPLLRNRKTLELYTMSGSLTSALEEHQVPVDHHFTDGDIYDAAKVFEPGIGRRGIRISDHMAPGDLKDYSNFLVMNRLEHMPDTAMDSILDVLAGSGPGKSLVILFRNRYSWFGLYDFLVRRILGKEGIDDIFFGTLRSLGPWRLPSRRDVKRRIERHGFRLVRTDGLFCFPVHRLAHSEWVRSNPVFSKASGLVSSVLSVLERIFRSAGLNRIFGEQILMVFRSK